MNKHRLFWDLYLAMMATTLVAVVAAAAYSFRVMDKRLIGEARQELMVRAELVARLLPDGVFSGNPGQAQTVCESVARVAGVRLTVVDAAGRVLADTEHDPATMENHATRPEIAGALAGTISQSLRDSATVKVRTLYVAIPIRRSGTVAGVVRAAVALPAVERLAGALRHQVCVAALVILLVSAAASYLVVRWVSRPIEELRRVAECYGGGDFGVRAPGSRWRELSDLASALNAMAERLQDRIETVTRQRNELETVLSGMVEGVAAFDDQGRLMRMNRAAGSLLELDPERDCGRHVFELIHHPDIQALMTRVLDAGEVGETEVEYETDHGRCLKVRGAPLTDAAGRRSGAVLVAEDYTRYRQLDRTRRDFVANASHELKTPIAAIKGAVETLQDWALEEPARARQFVDMAARQVERLENLAGDLLRLSSVEHDMDARRVDLEPVPLGEVLHGAVDACRAIAQGRGISLVVNCPDALQVAASAPLLEQAVVNLVENAIKYSDPGKAVAVDGLATVDGVEIQVRDEGCGIAPQHLDRIFERFYRVDPARSREAGGTGLGLSIVKHIALVHGGSVAVQSVPGAGSVFTIRLPKAKA